MPITVTTLPGWAIRATRRGDPGQTQHQIAWAGVGMQPAYAEATPSGGLRFGALLKAGAAGGTPVVVEAMTLTVEQATTWIGRRIDAFAAHPGAREGIEDAVRRKVIAAQGKPFVKRLRTKLDDEARMELDMMLSPDAHHQGAPLDESGPVVRVDGEGVVTGLTADSLVDTAGTAFVQEVVQPAPAPVGG